MKNKRIIFYTILISCIWLSKSYSQTVKDIDGNVYKTVTIGNQVWMSENLKTTKFNDGTSIPLFTVETNEWANHTVAASTSPAYCWLYDSALVYKDTYGAFYNGFTITTGNLCPSGWHIPSDEEWTSLTTYLGGEEVAGGKLKEEGTIHWNAPNNGATNETGFSARACGTIEDNGSNWNFGYNCSWWSSSANDEKSLWIRLIYGSVPNVYRTYSDKQVGYPVRCVR